MVGEKDVCKRTIEGIQWAQSQVSLRSFTWLSLIYFLKYKLAQNHFMTYPNLPEFGFPTIGIYSKMLKSSFFMKFKSIVPTPICKVPHII